MNVLILTPDRVGSTLLQRYITVIMNNHNYDKPVVNLHELTNGLDLYWNEQYNRQMIKKPGPSSTDPNRRQWGYYQKLPEIINILQEGDCYKTSRLALYHIKNRKDPIEDQLDFYSYLNTNFYIISAKRYNLFEYGISWCINTHSKNLNVFSHQQKAEVFEKIIQAGGIYVDPDSLTGYLNNYLGYEQWVDDHFNVSNFYYYERDVQDLDGFVEKLNIFPNGEQAKSFEDAYGMDWKTWNKCHYLLSDTSGISPQTHNLLGHNNVKLIEPPKQVEIPTDTGHITNSRRDLQIRAQRTDLAVEHQNFLKENVEEYSQVQLKLNKMREEKLLVTNIPIKLQTMLEKASMIKNYKEVFDVYNEWCIKNNQRERVLTLDQLKEGVINELNMWYSQ